MSTTTTDPVLLLDGATGTELEARGVDVGLPTWSARAIVHAPEALEQVHVDYLEAGAQAITTNTFRTHRRSLALVGDADRAEELTRRAVEIALAARDRVNPEARVLGSVAPLEDCYHPELSPDEAVCRTEHEELMRHLLDAGVDGLLIETMNTRHEAEAAAEVAARLAPGRWMISFCTKTDGPPGVLLHGAPMIDVLGVVSNAWAVGVNCVSADALTSQVALLRTLLPPSVRIAAYGNVGHPDETGVWRGGSAAGAAAGSTGGKATDPEQYADYAEQWIEAGATIIGGCCGTSPATTKAIAARIAGKGCGGEWGWGAEH